MVEITLHPLLAKRATSRQEKLSVAFQPGLTPKALLTEEGFSELDVEAVMVLRNDAQIDPETPLNDGDRVEFMVGIQGGSDPGASPCAPSS